MFAFYPQIEHSCPNVAQCPHLGGAAIASLVHVANHSLQTEEDCLRQIRALEKENAGLLSKVVSLEEQLEQCKLELKLERQNKFATNQQLNEDSEATNNSPAAEAANGVQEKRGAPVGHPGWFRPMPTEFDWAVDVPAPRRCPHCKQTTRHLPGQPSAEHLQEDIIDGVYRVVLDRHPACRCDNCRCRVELAGKGELLGSKIGPHLRAKALYLRHVIGISYRKVPEAINELFGVRFTPAALLGFEEHLARTARDWQKLTVQGSSEYRFFDDVRHFVARACHYHQNRKAGKLTKKSAAKERAWLNDRLEYLSTRQVEHEKAITLQGRLLRHYSEWLVFLSDSRVPPTNNLAERAIRPLVILRKITFGNRSQRGAERIALLMTVSETAKRHGHRPSEIYCQLLSRPPSKVLEHLYAGCGTQIA